MFGGSCRYLSRLERFHFSISHGNEPQMPRSSLHLFGKFRYILGQQLVNVLRALHNIRYTLDNDDDECDDNCDCEHHHSHSDNYTDIFGHQQENGDILDKLNDDLD